MLKETTEMIFVEREGNARNSFFTGKNGERKLKFSADPVDGPR